MILTNKTVCITAGNKGLGGEIVKLLVDKCKKVIVIDRSDPVYSHKKIVHIKVDLLKEKPDIEDVDIFISNLGMTLGPKEVNDMTYEDISNMIYININLQLWFYKNIRWKKFVFINSVMSYVGLENYSMYSACKSFIRIFNQSLLREKADTLIVYPYKINTSMFSEVTDFCTLDACDVAKSVVRGIENDAREIWLPFIFRYTELVFGIFPRFFINWILNIVSKVYLPKNKIN
jgi:short-subunit dehydrogenase